MYYEERALINVCEQTTQYVTKFLFSKYLYWYITIVSERNWYYCDIKYMMKCVLIFINLSHQCICCVVSRCVFQTLYVSLKEKLRLFSLYSKLLNNVKITYFINNCCNEIMTESWLVLINSYKYDNNVMSHNVYVCCYRRIMCMWLAH